MKILFTGGAKAVYRKLHEEGHTNISENTIRNVIKRCKKCQMYNPIKSREHKIAEVYSAGEKIGVGIIELSKGSNILVTIDYFTRNGLSKYLKSKTIDKIFNFLKKTHDEIHIKTLVIDEGKENIGKQRSTG